MRRELINTGAVLRLDRGCLRRWHLQLAAALTEKRVGVSALINDNPTPSLPVSVQLLLSLECMLTGGARPRLGDKVESAEFASFQAAGPEHIVLDLSSGDETQAATGSLRPLYDGVPGEIAVFAALLAGRSPTIEIERQSDRQILARGRPSLEGARNLNDCHEIIAATASDLLLTAVCRKATPLPPAEQYQAPPIGGAQVTEYMVKKLSALALGSLYRLCCYAPHWRVGWRFVTDQDVWDRMDLGGVPWNTIANPGLRFLADPFPLVWRGATYVFVEDFDHRLGKGIISVVPFNGSGPSAAPIPVLEEPWHLSYPFLFEDGGHIWMIPESCANLEISLYRATNFPTQWTKEAALLKNISAGDTTIVRHLGRLWMFTTLLNAGRSTDSLSIFTADALLGPWLPHPGNPVLLDAAAARSGGNIIARRGRLWRPVQDCRGRYGGALGLAEVSRLDDTGYSQILRKVLHPDAAWPGRRLHTLNRSGKLECIDGSGNLARAARYLPAMIG